MKYLVTGATGHFGSHVVEELLTQIPAENLAVSVRNPEKAAHLKAMGIDVRKGDFDEPLSLVEAFKGIDRLLIISADGDNASRIRQHTNAVSAAQAAGVKFIAYTSAANAKDSNLFLAIVHKTTEEAIEATGIPYAILRNNWYLENETSSIGAVIAGAPWLTSAGEGKVGWAPRKDYARAAARVLLDENVKNTVFELSGKPLTQSELANEVGKVLGKDVVVSQVTDEVYAEAMKSAGLPEFLIPMLVSIQHDMREGTLDFASDDLTSILGESITPLSEGIKEIVHSFK